MKLYFSPSACSMAAHIALVEAGLPHQLVKVDLRTHKTADGRDYYAINPKGYVPDLELDDGTRLTEAAVVLQYIADRKPGTLAPAHGTIERYRLQEWLNFIATELHKGFGPLWKPNTPEAYKSIVIENLGKRFDYIEPVLAKQPFLMGETFSVADAYLFTILSWAKLLKVDLSRWPAITSYLQRVGARPSVQTVHRIESQQKAAA
jgi:glutathione S-transferase